MALDPIHSNLPARLKLDQNEFVKGYNLSQNENMRNRMPRLLEYIEPK
jgi:hypothetical protein